MTRPVGVLAVRIWRDENDQIRTRVMAKLDVLDPAPAEISYPSPDGIEAVVTSWVRRYGALTNSSASRPG